ncbi:MAG: hypothetical protein BGO21_04980 [Dyadobacter sp. 50-39]|nr:MAG: hypothetical protein BGO21_04980 [Dyadobacter sp. 50-39]
MLSKVHDFFQPLINVQISEITNMTGDTTMPMELTIKIVPFHDPSPIFSEKAQALMKTNTKKMKKDIIIMATS